MGIIATIMGEENWVAVAEQMGEFQVKHRLFGGGCEASLAFGSYSDVRLHIYGQGPNFNEATRACVLKARTILKAMAEHAPRKG
jgi:hypothetical protein